MLAAAYRAARYPTRSPAWAWRRSAAKHIKAPLIAGCHANVECRVVDSMEGPGVTLFMAEALAVYLDRERPPVLRLAGKTYLMGPPA